MDTIYLLFITDFLLIILQIEFIRKRGDRKKLMK
jgi:hypothetical protein